jgi:drug/metabolite transporter (DMT)-like permease
VRTAVLTALALVAFAGNSLLCRMALGQAAIDAASFSTIRIIAGALCLWIITLVTRQGSVWTQGSWLAAVTLFVYAIPFSYAYGLLTAGTGALILFGTLQVTMIGGALFEGERPRARQWIGLIVAIAGLVYLLFPGIASPSPLGAVLMAIAGLGWALYSIQGRGAVDPVAQNGGNFVRTLPMLLVVSVFALRQQHIETSGAILAILSGAVTTGLGYAVWYSALRGLTATRAALVQLLVPVITVTGGVVFLREPLSPRIVLSAAIVIGGIALALTDERTAYTRAG